MKRKRKAGQKNESGRQKKAKEKTIFVKKGGIPHGKIGNSRKVHLFKTPANVRCLKGSGKAHAFKIPSKAHAQNRNGSTPGIFYYFYAGNTAF